MPLALLVPLATFFVLFFVAPLGLLVGVSALAGPDQTVVGATQYVKFLTDRTSLEILLDTIVLGAQVTGLTLVLGYPLAWVVHRSPPRLQPLLVFAIILPLLTSVVVRTFAWIVLLGRQGIVNDVLLRLGLIDAPLRLLFNKIGVLVALTQVLMPMMVLPLVTALGRVDPSLSEASAALGAGAWRTFFRVVLPLTRPGIIAGCVLTYAGAVSAFITHTLIGGQRLVFMPFFIYEQAIVLRDWPMAAAMSVIFLVSVLVVVLSFNVLGRAGRGYVAT